MGGVWERSSHPQMAVTGSYYKTVPLAAGVKLDELSRLFFFLLTARSK
jgi:hypothetical protein